MNASCFEKIILIRDKIGTKIQSSVYMRTSRPEVQHKLLLEKKSTKFTVSVNNQQNNFSVIKLIFRNYSLQSRRSSGVWAKVRPREK